MDPGARATDVAATAGHPEEYYELLEVARDATTDQIKRAYRQQALKWHPDKQDAANRSFAEARFKLVSEAYQVLSDPQKRTVYDQFGRDGVQGGSSGFGGNGGFSGFGQGFPGFPGFGGPGVRVVITRSGPGGVFTETRSGGGVAGFNNHPFFNGGGGMQDPFDLFRDLFGSNDMFGRGDPFANQFGGNRVRSTFGGPSIFNAGGGFDDSDPELRRAMELSLQEEQLRQQQKLQEMQPDIDDDVALQEALRLSREEQ